MIPPNCIIFKDGTTSHYLPQGLHLAYDGTLPPTVGKLPEGIITWSLENISGDIPHSHDESISFGYTFEQWQLQEHALTFRRVPAATGATIPIKFLHPSDPEYSGLFPDNNILAVTYYPVSQNGSLASHMYFNDDPHVIWSETGASIPEIDPNTGRPTGNMMQTYWLPMVGRHESGHAMGLPHVTDPNNTMYPYYNSKMAKLGTQDIAEIQSLYGKRDIAQRIIDAIDSVVSRNVEFRD